MKKPKYNVGDKVWKLVDDKACEVEITGVFYGKKVERIKNTICFYYCLAQEIPTSFYEWKKEDILFPTKEELINSL